MFARILISLAAFVCGCTWTTAPVQAQTRRAVIVGINEYSAAAPEVEATEPNPFTARNITDLENAVPDAEIFAALLTGRFGFETEDVVLLLDQDATRANILGALREHLVDKAKPGDTSVFYFVGHGSRILSSHARAVSGMDQTLVPADALGGARDIWDKELAFLLNEALDKGAAVTAIFGSCFSGDVARGDGPGSRGRAAPHCVQIDALEAFADQPAIVADTRDAPADRGAIVITASGPNQVAMAVPKTVSKDGADLVLQRGLFGWHLLNALRSSPVDEPAWNVFLRVKARMRAEPYRQQPRFEPAGPGGENERARPLFGAAPRGVTGEVLVGVISSDTAAGEVLVDGGYAHGIAEGCRLVLNDAEDNLVHEFEVTQVLDLNRATAKWIAGSQELGAVDLSLALLSVKIWGAPAEPLLRLHLPRAAPAGYADGAFLALAAELRNELGERWVDDPSDADPTHVLRFGPGGWALESERERHAFDGLPSAQDVLAALGTDPTSRVFYRVPCPSEVTAPLSNKIQEQYSFVALTARADADFVLTGRAHGEDLQITWCRPIEPMEHARPAALRTLPASTDWTSLEDAAKLRLDLESLARMRGWMTLTSPPRPRGFPYRFVVHGLPLDDTGNEYLALAGMPYAFEMIADQAPRFAQHRHLYLIGIDGTNGRGLHLTEHPEERFPLADGSKERIRMSPPVIGTGDPSLSTFVLLSSSTSVADRSAMSWEPIREERLSLHGARGADEDIDPLQLLIEGIHGARRSSTRPMPDKWSVDQIQVRSTDLIPRAGTYELWCFTGNADPKRDRHEQTNRFIAPSDGTLRVRVARTDPEQDPFPNWRGCRRDDDQEPVVRITGLDVTGRSVELHAGQEINITCAYDFPISDQGGIRVAKLLLELEFIPTTDD